MLAKEKKALGGVIEMKLEGRRPTGIRAADERSSRCSRLAKLEEAAKRIRVGIEDDRKEIAERKALLEKRRAAFASATVDFTDAGKNARANAVAELNTALGHYATTVDVLVQSRRILVRELVSVFRLRRVQRPPTSSTGPARNTPLEKKTGISPNAPLATTLFCDDPQEYRVINVGFCSLGDYLAYPREKFNAGIGHVVHMLILMTHYLGVRVPFELTNKGSKSLAKGYPGFLPAVEGYSGTLGDTNRPRAMPTGETSSTSAPSEPENRRSSVPDVNADLPSPFTVDFYKVVRLHSALRRRQRPNYRNKPATGSGGSEQAYRNANFASDPGVLLLASVLDEDSEDEDDGNGVDADWHLVSF
ncbi:hypothetical protein HK101_006695 [Irineochytrium annulatum]|nr:hypothetical protein HK101_006695 [Irineochytrium annulatum]